MAVLSDNYSFKLDVVSLQTMDTLIAGIVNTFTSFPHVLNEN